MVKKYNVYFYIKDGEDVYLSEPKEIEFPKVSDVGFDKIEQKGFKNDAVYQLKLSKHIKNLYSNGGSSIAYSGVFVYNSLEKIKDAIVNQVLGQRQDQNYYEKSEKHPIALGIIDTEGDLLAFNTLLKRHQHKYLPHYYCSICFV